MIEREEQLLRDMLTSIVSSNYLFTDPSDCAAYAVQGVVPALVVAPGSLDELAEVMRVASERRAAVVPWGGGTGQYIGAPPRQIDLLIRCERLNHVLIHEPDDLTISVEAGMTMGALRSHLESHGQMLPLDPPLPDRATIGGLIATATDGPRRLGYGTLRDLLIGIAVVEVSGRISRGGGMVVKNVSGFDMMKLYLGSFGTLAIIASANFKLLPIPPSAATLTCVFTSAEEAFGFVEALQLTQLTPTAAEYFNTAALAALEIEGLYAVVLRAEGLQAAVERHVHDLSRLAESYHAAAITRSDGSVDREMWARIANFPQTAMLKENEAVLKLTTLPSELDRTIARIEQFASETKRSAAIAARALNGVVFVRLLPTNAEDLNTFVSTLPGVQWIATPIKDAPHWGVPQGRDLMRRIKHEFDPLGLLNRGRFVDGL